MKQIYSEKGLPYEYKTKHLRILKSVIYGAPNPFFAQMNLI